MKRHNFSHILEINLAMVFIGTSGALGRYVELPVPVTIACRGLLAFLLLYIFCKWKKISLNVNRKDLPVIILSGLLMGLHWVSYFYALQLSNVAIGMLSLFTYPVITAFLEPLVLRTKLQWMHLLLGALVISGIYFLAPNFDIKESNTIAIGIGVFSAFCYALRNLVLKSQVKKYHGSMLMVYQVAIVGMALLPFVFYTDITIVLGQWKGLLVLALLTTAIGHTLFLMTFKHFSITTVSILSSIQPVYGIVIGIIFLGEIPELRTVFGGILILASVVIESFRVTRKPKLTVPD